MTAPEPREPDDGQGQVRVERHGPVATLILDHPRRRNTMTERMWRQLGPALEALADDPAIRVVLVRGAGEDFSAGADIGNLDAILQDASTGRHDGGALAVGEAALASFHKPTVAAVDGYCLGGAWQIAAACDIRLASRRAVFGITPAKIGIVYPVAGIERLVRIAGPAAAKYLLFSGEFVDAGHAQRLGLVQDVLDTGTFWTEVESFVETLASRSQLSIQAMKDIVDTAASGAGPEDTAAASAHWQRLMASSGDAVAGVTAFRQKQTPRFAWNGGTAEQRRATW